MELILNRSLRWFVCQLHANELPLRHLFAHMDKTTTGPRSLTGEIRKSLAGCEKLSVVSSTPIENTLCEVTNKKDLTQFTTKDSISVLKLSQRFRNSSLLPGIVGQSFWRHFLSQISNPPSSLALQKSTAEIYPKSSNVSVPFLYNIRDERRSQFVRSIVAKWICLFRAVPELVSSQRKQTASVFDADGATEAVVCPQRVRLSMAGPWDEEVSLGVISL
ncbi:hypothetical protein AVEN_178500-1 [Araneus ventricosus]|uniref:Uncharacterized protein n=1 Tax=Araneus ventricosus TaxID=182803 RepID=A0A4Y2CE85_ARAVE|nr:hypothetical protein AVEN_178500-1 [Araneus ventricosus]